MPGREVEGLFFGYPSPDNDRAGENAWVQSQIDPTSNSRALVLAAPEDNQEQVRRLIATGTFVGIKPYRLYANVPDTREAEIESFAPDWMWQVCHDHHGILMLHIMLADGLSDPRNLEAIRRLARSYPHCRLVLAHIARSFHYRHARYLNHLVDLDNVVVDTSAITQAGAFRAGFGDIRSATCTVGKRLYGQRAARCCITKAMASRGFTRNKRPTNSTRLGNSR